MSVFELHHSGPELSDALTLSALRNLRAKSSGRMGVQGDFERLPPFVALKGRCFTLLVDS
jgi:hypothetical protein